MVVIWDHCLHVASVKFRKNRSLLVDKATRTAKNRQSRVHSNEHFWNTTFGFIGNSRFNTWSSAGIRINTIELWGVKWPHFVCLCALPSLYVIFQIAVDMTGVWKPIRFLLWITFVLCHKNCRLNQVQWTQVKSISFLHQSYEVIVFKVVIEVAVKVREYLYDQLSVYLQTKVFNSKWEVSERNFWAALLVKVPVDAADLAKLFETLISYELDGLFKSVVRLFLHNLLQWSKPLTVICCIKVQRVALFRHFQERFLLQLLYCDSWGLPTVSEHAFHLSWWMHSICWSRSLRQVLKQIY